MPIIVECPTCGGKFETYPSDVANRATHCCSIACCAKLRKKMFSEGTRPLPPKQKRRLPLDESVFDIITPESAYWIGFLIADGCVYKMGNSQMCLSVGLGPKDHNHLEKLKSFLRCGHKIGPFGKHDGKNLRISSDKICKRLGEFGIVPRKSMKEKAIGIENDRDFWRGVVDGDGWLAANNTLCLCGSFDLLSQYSKYAKKVIPKAKLRVRKSDGIFRVSASGRYAKTLAKHLYKNGDVALERKRKIAALWAVTT